ncbi:hypothetical protein AB0O76_31965 [Streptomyces sp. NPDC086554]|uniref:hypothetical protein n=1 Tax=Streptomyces sp. NPDC086554 TaxID=3154864 RepID=UPI00343324D0
MTATILAEDSRTDQGWDFGTYPYALESLVLPYLGSGSVSGKRGPKDSAEVFIPQSGPR